MIAPAQRPLRVLHVLHSLGSGGAERIVCDLAGHRAAELETAVVCLDALGPLARPLEEMGARVFCTHRQGRDWRQATLLAALIRRLRPDVIHAHQYTPYFYAALAATAERFGSILFTEHGRHWPDRVSAPRRAVNQLLRLRRDTMTAVCRFVADALRHNERIAARDVRVIPNGVPCEDLQRPRRRAWLADLVGAPPQSPLLIQVARMHKVKDHATSLRALARLAGQGGDPRLILVGDGPERPALERLAGELNISGAVHMLGDRNDVPDLLASADAFVLSSVSEGASLAILEAMNAGLPVAATDVGGNAEIVRHGRTGLLSPRADHLALAQNLATLLDQPALRERMGQAARLRAQEKFNQRHMHQAFIDLYHHLAEGAAK